LGITLCSAQSYNYNEYSVVKLYGVTEKDIVSFYEQNIDVWAASRADETSWADLMLHQDQLDEFLRLFPNHKIVLDNVQTELDRHANEMAEIRNRTEPQAFFDNFPTYPQVIDFLDEQLRLHPTVTKSISLAGGIRGIQLGNNVAAAPIFYIHCTIHAREWITTPSCCWIIEKLLTTNTNLLNKFTYLIVPVLNVNGYIYSHTPGNRLWRKNRQANSGSSCVGTDLNRNYGVHFGGPGSGDKACDETYRGTHAFSGPETAAEKAFLDVYKGKVAAYVDIHAYGGYFMCPWGWTYTLPPAVDYNEMSRLMTIVADAIYIVDRRRYITGSSANAIYIAAGGSDDWAYGDGGVIPSFTVEVYGNSFTPGVADIKIRAPEVYAGIVALSNSIKV